MNERESSVGIASCYKPFGEFRLFDRHEHLVVLQADGGLAWLEIVSRQGEEVMTLLLRSEDVLRLERIACGSARLTVKGAGTFSVDVDAGSERELARCLGIPVVDTVD